MKITPRFLNYPNENRYNDVCKHIMESTGLKCKHNKISIETCFIYRDLILGPNLRALGIC